MALYVIQARGADRASLERATIIKDGFSWAAFVFGPFWLLYRRLWLALLLWVALEVAFVLVVAPNVPGGVSTLVDLLAHLFIGLEGNRLRLAKSARRASLVDVMEGRDRDDAEIRFFRRLFSEVGPVAESAATEPLT